jgi:MerR family redox-sensitive transcriptional activator SoxR
MTIREVSERTGLSSSTIRYYEQERLIPPVARRSGRRVFDDRSLAQLAVVQLARDAGFTIAEVRQLVTEFGQKRWRLLAGHKIGEIKAAAERLRTMTVLLEKLLGCECPDIEFCGRILRRRIPRNGSGAEARDA